MPKNIYVLDWEGNAYFSGSIHTDVMTEGDDSLINKGYFDKNMPIKFFPYSRIDETAINVCVNDLESFTSYKVSIDNKGRIFLPTFTSREEGDQVVLVFNDILGVHEIYSVSALEEKFKQIEEQMMQATTKKDVIFYKKRLYQLSKEILRSSKVDSQGRVLIGKTFEDENKLLITGAYDHIMIEPIKKK